MVKGVCHLCGRGRSLTKEHVPPRAAFNDATVRRRIVDRTNTRARGKVSWREFDETRGSFARTLCEKCNNWTGSVYAPEYIEFAKMFAPHANVANVVSGIGGSTPPFRPLRIVKQVLTMICATTVVEMDPNDELNVWNPTRDKDRGIIAIPPSLPSGERERFEPMLEGLRAFVLDQRRTHLPEPSRLYAYIVADRAGRHTGLARITDRFTGNFLWCAEVAFWPLGWVLVFDGDVTREPLLDITRWAELGYDEAVEMGIQLPCNRLVGRYPIDFREPREISSTQL